MVSLSIYQYDRVVKFVDPFLFVITGFAMCYWLCIYDLSNSCSFAERLGKDQGLIRYFQPHVDCILCARHDCVWHYQCGWKGNKLFQRFLFDKYDAGTYFQHAEHSAIVQISC